MKSVSANGLSSENTGLWFSLRHLKKKNYAVFYIAVKFVQMQHI